jgi:hypothetical protein
MFLNQIELNGIFISLQINLDGMRRSSSAFHYKLQIFIVAVAVLPLLSRNETLKSN